MRHGGTQSSLHKVISLKPRIVVKEEFKVMGIKRRIHVRGQEFVQLWENFIARIPEIENAINSKCSYNFCLYEPDFKIQDMSDDVKIDFLACVEVSNFSVVPADMVTKVVSQQKYAIFYSDNSRKIYNYIFGEWARNSDYELAEADDFEYYDHRYNPRDIDRSTFRIYVPIK
jgi:AraC family transcriptional regulator